jgi:hypothetical protein
MIASERMRRWYERIRNDPVLWAEHLRKRKEAKIQRIDIIPENPAEESSYIELHKSRKRSKATPNAIAGISLAQLMAGK